MRTTSECRLYSPHLMLWSHCWMYIHDITFRLLIKISQLTDIPLDLVAECDTARVECAVQLLIPAICNISFNHQEMVPVLTDTEISSRQKKKKNLKFLVSTLILRSVDIREKKMSQDKAWDCLWTMNIQSLVEVQTFSSLTVQLIVLWQNIQEMMIRCSICLGQSHEHNHFQGKSLKW